MKVPYQIIIVDDDADDREIMKDAFASTGQNLDYVFFESGDGLLEHLQTATNSLPSLIMLDLNMPGKDGRETLKEIKADGQLRSLPIIVFTTSSSHRDKKISYDLGANCFVTKPDTFNKLTDLAKSIISLWLQ
jgi:CheY-like chemotaxis protein